MQRKFPHHWLLVLLLGWMPGCASPPPNFTLHIFYTGNLNGALDDCRCGGPLVGGMTRILTVFDSLRQAHPQHLLVDAGDFLRSYSLPAGNRVMLEVLSLAGYTALNLGDQEFVESDTFLANLTAGPNPALPLISTNIRWPLPANPPAVPVIAQNIGGVPVTIRGVVDSSAFEFIPLPGVTVTSPDRALQDGTGPREGPAGVQILLFHGPEARLEMLLANHPWIDVAVVSHSQKRQFRQIGHTAVVQAGADGEYVGHLVLRKNGPARDFQNEFIPILENLAVHSRAAARVEAYYRSLNR